MKKQVTVEFEIDTDKTGNDALTAIVERAIKEIAPTLITKIDVRVYNL